MASPELERSAGVRRFSPAARTNLEKKGYVVYELTGQSISSLREAGRPFWSTWHKEYPEFETLASMASQVAVDPKRLFLPDSNNRTDSEQERLVREHSEVVRRISRTVRAIIGHAPDYAELYFAHLDATGEHLFGGTELMRWARTGTTAKYDRVGYWEVVEYRAIISCDISGGLALDYRKPLVRLGDVFAVPLIVPIGG